MSEEKNEHIFDVAQKNEPAESAEAKLVEGAQTPPPLPGDDSPFVVDETGVYYKPESMHICDALYIDAQTRDEHNENWSRLLRWADNEGHVHTWMMPMARLAAEPTGIVAHLISCGLHVDLSRQAKERLIEYLQQPVDKTIRCVSRTGWHKGAFVLPDETFACGQKEEIRYYRTGADSNETKEALGTKGSLKGWQDTIGAWCVGNSRLGLAVSMGFAGPLLELVGEQGGGIQITGGSSDGKTTALRACASVLGSPKIIRTWRTTSNGLESVASLYNHLTLPIDELAQSDPKEAGDVAYMIANGVGKSRADQSGGARQPSRWNVLALSTGEVTLAEHAESAGQQLKAGAEVRFNSIESDTGAGHRLFENLHGASDGAEFSRLITDAVAKSYGHPLRTFLSWLVAHRSAVEVELRTAMDSFVRRNASETSSEVQRACKQFALIAIAGELATKAGVTGWPAGEAIWAAEKCFQSYLAMRGSVGDSDTEKAVQRALEFIEQYGDSRFQEITYKGQRLHPLAGYRRSEHGEDIYYFLRSVFRNQICKGADHKKVAALLSKRGMLLHDPDRWTKKIRIPGRHKSEDVYAIVLREEEHQGDPQ